VLGLSIALAISFLTTVGRVITSIILFERKPLPSSTRFCSLTALFLAIVRYNPSLNLCSLTKSIDSPSFIVFWATQVGSPWMLLLFSSDLNDLQLAFDFTMLAFTIYNSLSKPRDLKTTLRQTLYRDGILFFLVCIRRHRAIYCACSLRPSCLH